jgi:NAD(P)-dependent dehydrogenase (short-subunit alcohol dehydrogenase family)
MHVAIGVSLLDVGRSRSLLANAMPYWQDKICLVAGGSAGLGLAIGRALANAGAQTILVARRKEPLDIAVVDITARGGRATALVGDVAWQEDVDRIAATVTRDFGRLDLLCNCTGRSTRGAILDAGPEDFQQLLDVNFLAAVRTTRALAPLLLASRGHLVNIGSLASKVAAPFLGAYPASKFALAAYTQQLRLELGPRGLHVMLVCPGPLARSDAGQRYATEGAGEIPASAHLPGGGARVAALLPDQVAVDILAACEHRRPELVIPARARLLFAISQLSARWGDWLLRRQLK